LEKLLGEFWRDENHSDGHRSACKECTAAQKRRYSKTHREEINEYNRHHRGNNEKYKAKVRQRWKANHVRLNRQHRHWRKANPEKQKEMERRYRELHQEELKERAQYRRALKRNNSAERVDLGVIRGRDGMVCHICGKKINQDLEYPHPMSLSYDHLIPISHGGPHAEWNLAVAHLGCNSSRGPGRTSAQLHLPLKSALGLIQS